MSEIVEVCGCARLCITYLVYIILSYIIFPVLVKLAVSDTTRFLFNFFHQLLFIGEKRRGEEGEGKR